MEMCNYVTSTSLFYHLDYRECASVVFRWILPDTHLCFLLFLLFKMDRYCLKQSIQRKTKMLVKLQYIYIQIKLSIPEMREWKNILAVIQIRILCVSEIYRKLPQVICPNSLCKHGLFETIMTREITRTWPYTIPECCLTMFTKRVCDNREYVR